MAAEYAVLFHCTKRQLPGFFMAASVLVAENVPMSRTAMRKAAARRLNDLNIIFPPWLLCDCEQMHDLHMYYNTVLRKTQSGKTQV